MAEWINKTDPDHPLSLEEIQHDSTVYLVPGFEDEMNMEEAIEKYLKANYQGLFLQELSSWYQDPSVYPKMTYPLFREWFEITIHTMVFDLVKGPVTKDKPE